MHYLLHVGDEYPCGEFEGVTALVDTGEAATVAWGVFGVFSVARVLDWDGAEVMTGGG